MNLAYLIIKRFLNSWDIDKYNGGYFKVFEKIGGKLKRIGTADEKLNIFKK